MKHIILLKGNAECGKSTTSKIITDFYENLNKKVIKDMFAKYIKSYMMQLNLWDGQTKDKIFRGHAQYIGTELIQYELKDKTFHCRRLAEDITILSYLGADVFIIDDLRLLREYHYFKSYFDINEYSVNVIEVIRNKDNKLTKEQRNHKSEKENSLIPSDIIIENNGTVEELKDKVIEQLKLI